MKSDSRITKIRRGRFAHRRKDSSRGERWVKRKWKVDSWAERVKKWVKPKHGSFFYILLSARLASRPPFLATPPRSLRPKLTARTGWTHSPQSSDLGIFAYS